MDLIPRQFVPTNNTGSKAIVVVSWIFPVLATFAVATRFAARRLRKSELRLDDWVILSALVPVWGHTAVILCSVYLGGIGHHERDLGPQNSVVLYKTLTALQFSFGLSLGLIKTSIVLLLMRIFFTRKFKLFASAVLCYCLCWMLMTILIGACMCRPFAKNWNPSLPGHCGDRIHAYISIAAFDILGDLLILSLPMPMIWRLQSSTVNKIGLTFVFALGLLDIIVGILRIIYLVGLDTAKDYTWTAVDCWIWSVLEPSLAVFVACGPTIGPIVAACLGYVRQITHTGGSSGKGGPSGGSSSLGHQYPPFNPKQFGHISDTEFPLQPAFGNSTITTTTTTAVEGKEIPNIARGRTDMKKRDDDNHDDVEFDQEGVGMRDGVELSPWIHVQRDVQVRRSPKDYHRPAFGDV